MPIRALTRALMIVGCILVGAGAEADTDGITVLSSRPDLVSGGDALVAIDGSGAVTLNGTEITAAFKSSSGDKRIGLVEGLKPGANILKAGSVSLTPTNHPIRRPVFARPHQTPFHCMTAHVH